MEKKIENKKVLKTIQDLVAVESYHDALRLCEKKEYANDLAIQAERLFILVKKVNRIKEAYSIWQEYRDSNDVNIVIRGMDILAKFKMFDEALDYANQFAFDDIRYIRSKIKLLLELGRCDQALELCEDKRYATDDVVKNLKEKVYKKLHKPIKDEVADLLTRIYADSISLQDIKEAEIDTYSKSVVMLAYYEKYNMKSGIDFLKKIRKIEGISDEYKKNYARIYQKLVSSKKKFFDVTFYTNLLDREINHALVNELAKKQEEVSVKKETIASPNVVKLVTKKAKKKSETKYAEVIGVRVNSRYNNVSKTANINNMQKHTVLIKDLLSNELNDLGRYLYVMMQLPDSRKNAIKAWDNLENMAYKPASDKETLRRLLNLILKVSVEHPEIVDADSKKFVKLLEK